MIEEHETWRLYDSSKLQEYLKCPRSYFFRYILGWKRSESNIHLHFGKCWHSAMEYLLRNGNSDESCEAAAELFERQYREVIPDAVIESSSPKTPGYAKVALKMYVEKYRSDSFEVLHTEAAGAVPIRQDRILHFKVDAIIRDREDGLIKVLEHKTAGQSNSARRDSWKLSLQVGTYTYLLYCLYNEDAIYGVVINEAVFTKTKVAEFIRIPCRKTPQMLEMWLHTVNAVISRIEEDIEMLKECSEDDIMMKPFLMTATMCSTYGGCSYLPFCLTVANPLRISHEIPEGFVQEWWNPYEQEIKEKLNIGGNHGN